MRLATFFHHGIADWGIVLRHPREERDWIFAPSAVTDAALALPKRKGAGYTWWRPDFLPGSGAWPASLESALAQWEEISIALRRMHDFLGRFLEQADPCAFASAGWPIDSVTLRAPLSAPRLLLGVVGNNAGFLRMDPARGRNLQQPSCHQRSPTTILGPGEPIVLPPEGADYAGTTELGVVIGRAGKNIAREHAREHIAGYTVINDGLGSVYARRWAELDRANGIDGTSFHAMNSASWLDKNADGMLAMGPWLVTPEELGDPYDLLCWYRETGVVRNRAHSGAIVCGIEETIHWLSTFLTLEPGMVLHLGAMAQDGLAAPPVMRRAADHWVECEIERIGSLRNPLRIAAAPVPPPEQSAVRRDFPPGRAFWTLLANTTAASTRTKIPGRPYPQIYNTPTTALARNGVHVRSPGGRMSATAELGVVIGRATRNVDLETARRSIRGHVPVLALRTSWFGDRLLSPHALPANMPEVYGRWPEHFNVVGEPVDGPAPQDVSLRIEAGDAHASARASDYLLDAASVISELSRAITLQPGDIIALGETAATLPLPAANAAPLHVRVIVGGVGSVEAWVANSPG